MNQGMNEVFVLRDGGDGAWGETERLPGRER